MLCTYLIQRRFAYLETFSLTVYTYVDVAARCSLYIGGGKSPGPTASPGPPGSKGVAALALAMDESDIVLDRLGKEIVTLLKQGRQKAKAHVGVARSPR